MGLQKQKEEKKKNLVLAAYDLFLSKGVQKTSIDEIVQKANVAKGTFYLYFKDKSEVMEEIVLKISYYILQSAYKELKKNNTPDFIEGVFFVTNHIIEYFKKNILVLKLIERNFSWPLVRARLESSDDPEINEIIDLCFYNPYMSHYSREESFKLFFMVIELVGSICYTSIIHQQPAPIDEMKPILFRTIEKILR